MWDVVIAMIPASVFGVYQFGWKALLVLIATVASCVLSEYVFERVTGRPITISDGSAVVNGKYDNDPDGQTILKTALIDYFNGMARRKAINGFDSDKIVIADGVEINAVTVDVAVRLLGSMEFAYINVNLNR